MISALPLLLLAAQAISLDVNTQEGATIAGDYDFRVTVKSEKAISQVEFYVGEDLRASDSSTPYEFHLDSLAEGEGAKKISFIAYTIENESAKKVLNITIDNGVSKGADFHVQRAKDALTVSKWDDAIQAGRIALKAQPGYNPARVVMARAYLAKGVLDSAQRYAEDAVASDPAYREASELLTVINLQRAFNTFHRGTEDPGETLSTVATALKAAATQRKKNLDDTVDAMKTTDAVAYADTAIRAGRYSAAVNALLPAFRAEPSKPAIANRIAYSQVRMSKFAEAYATYNESRKRQSLDAYGNALTAVIAYNLGSDQIADDAMKEAILSDNEDFGVRSAQVYLAIARNKRDVVSKLARDLALESSMLPEVQYYLTTVYSWSRDFEQSRRAFERCVMAEPAMPDAYVLRANESLTLAIADKAAGTETGDRSKQIEYNFKVAKMFYEAALASRPEAADAMIGLSIIGAQQKDFLTSYKFALAAAAAQPSYAAARYGYAYAAAKRQNDLRGGVEAIRKQNKDGSLTDDQRAQIAKMNAEANQLQLVLQAEMKAYGELDKVQLQGRSIPTLEEVQKYFLKSGRLPVMTAPK